MTSAGPTNFQKKGEKKRSFLIPGRACRPFSEEFTNQEDNNELKKSQLVVSLRYLHLSPITAISILLQSRIETDHTPEKLQKSSTHF